MKRLARAWRQVIAMIDPVAETLVPLCKAAKLLPSSRKSEGQHVSTLHRWARKGLRGVRLEVIRIGGTTCTSREALGRFFAALSPDEAHAPQSAPQLRSNQTQQVLRDAGLTEPPRDRQRRSAARAEQASANASKRPECRSRDDDASQPSTRQRPDRK